MDRDVLERRRGSRCVDYLQQHGAAVLVKEFRRWVDVVVCSRVRAPDHHYGVAWGVARGGVVHAVVVYWRLEEVGVLFEPGVVFVRFGEERGEGHTILGC